MNSRSLPFRLGVTTAALLALAAPLRADLLVRPSGDHGVRITIAADESKLTLNPAFVELKWPAPVLRVKDGEAAPKTKVGSLMVTVKAKPTIVRVETAAGRLVQELEFSDTDGVINFAVGDAPVLGLGEGGDQFDRRGANYRVINGQRDRLAELGTRIFTPFLIGTKGWALLIGTPVGAFDLRNEKAIFTPQSNSVPGMTDLYVVDAEQPANAMGEYIRLTGAPVMPPKWAMGYMQSHRTLSNEVDVLMEAQLFRDRKLPLDALIYLGTDFCPRGWNYGHDSFEFNTNVFTRSAAEVIKDLHAKNIKVAVHVVPQNSALTPFTGPPLVNPPASTNRSAVIYPRLHGSIPPAPGEEVDRLHIASYWERHVPLMKAGMDAWWPDEGDWLDIPSRLERFRMYYEGPLSTRPNVRPWDLQRNGYMGISKFGGWHWSGDIQSTWKTLAAQVKVGQNSSLSVSPFWGTDTGGFYPAATKEYTGELYTRWFQFSTFCPSFRSHGRTWRLHTPWGWNLGETGPVESRPAPDESELHNTTVEPICRDYLNLRYQLMPYTYTLTREARDTGMPLMRAMWLHYPTDAEAVARGDQYLWGKDLLVAPITEPGATKRELYLPKGDWYDWWSGEKTAGGAKKTRTVDLKTMPIYVRAGAIIPFDPVRQYVDEPVTEPTAIRVYRGADGSFALYDDDGKSQEYLTGAGSWTAFTWHDADKRLEIKLDPRTSGRPASREFEVVLLPDNQKKKVTFTGTPAEVKF